MPAHRDLLAGFVASWLGDISESGKAITKFPNMVRPTISAMTVVLG
jgi:hypothetical protein